MSQVQITGHVEPTMTLGPFADSEPSSEDSGIDNQSQDIVSITDYSEPEFSKISATGWG